MLPVEWVASLAALSMVVLMVIFLWPVWRHRQRTLQIAHARLLFRRRREWLEAKFVTLASASGKPRGLNWVNCDFEDEYAVARDRGTGQLRALVGLAIQFESVPGGELEHAAAVGNLRAATAVFYYEAGEWKTDGRAVFNLNPAQTIRRFQHELEAAE